MAAMNEILTRVTKMNGREGPGDLRYDYGDYRQMQRSVFSVSVLKGRGRWKS
jgi:hypothetical protein